MDSVYVLSASVAEIGQVAAIAGPVAVIVSSIATLLFRSLDRRVLIKVTHSVERAEVGDSDELGSDSHAIVTVWVTNVGRTTETVTEIGIRDARRGEHAIEPVREAGHIDLRDRAAQQFTEALRQGWPGVEIRGTVGDILGHDHLRTPWPLPSGAVAQARLTLTGQNAIRALGLYRAFVKPRRLLWVTLPPVRRAIVPYAKLARGRTVRGRRFAFRSQSRKSR